MGQVLMPDTSRSGAIIGVFGRITLAGNLVQDALVRQRYARVELQSVIRY
jgi:hypothetical protein